MKFLILFNAAAITRFGLALRPPIPVAFLANNDRQLSKVAATPTVWDECIYMSEEPSPSSAFESDDSRNRT
jgi:hypothetical protein